MALAIPLRGQRHSPPVAQLLVVRRQAHLLHERGHTESRTKGRETRNAPSLPDALGTMERCTGDDGGVDSVTANAPDCHAT